MNVRPILPADHADSLAVEVGARQADNAEIELARAVVRLVQPAVQCEQQPHRMLGDRVRRVGRHAHDVQLFKSGLHVHIAVSGAAHGDELHAVVVEPLDGERVDAVVHEGAHGVEAVGEFGGVVVELLLEVRDLVILAERVEPSAVVRLRIEKCDFFHGGEPPVLFSVCSLCRINRAIPHKLREKRRNARPCPVKSAAPAISCGAKEASGFWNIFVLLWSAG